MAVDYDLVIIGNGEKAALTAMRAAQLKARVALVTNPDVLDLEQVQMCLGELLSDRTIWEQPQAVIAQIRRELHPYNQLELLQTSGVDVILGCGQFSDHSTFPGFITSKPPQRRLQARAFAIAVDQSPPLRQIMGLSEVDYLTCAQMLKMLQLGSLPKKLAVIGGSAIDCIVAQTLCRLGHNVTIFTDSPHIFAHLDVEIARILQAQLEVEGITIYTASRITAVTKHNQTSYQLWAGEHTSHYAQILFPSQRDNWVRHLNLAQAGVAFSASTSASTFQEMGDIRVNAKRQTTNHRIYICQQRTDIRAILANTLFLPTARATNQIVTQAISMQPPTASVGMTEMEARLQYGKDLFTLHTPPQQASQSTDLEFCKLLCRRNGKIVGAHAVGNNALEIIETVAIAMNVKLNVYQLGRLADASSGTITQLATQLAQQIYSRNFGRQVWLEKWFNWRRQWNV
jgi:pyruvate/2-oxoglutarate dehydrogenase complex dihydrolipoamide dehydrogenase (E3) component